MRKLLTLFTLIGASLPLFAQNAATAAAPATAQTSGINLMNVAIGVFVSAIVVLLIVIFILLKVVKVLSKELLNPSAAATTDTQRLEWEEWEAAEKEKPSIWNKILSLKPLSEEKDMMLDHEFDGISELDNPTPPWFMWLFYLTIIFAIGYWVNYHVLETSPLQDEEYAIEMKQAAAEKAALLSGEANKIDENSVKIDPAMIAAGKATFMVNCVACHGDKGQGGVGPNLTDDYWIHGGSVNNVFKTIKYGVPEKGMVSWEKTMTPKKMAELANFILSLKGTNPPNAKAPQGNKEG